MNWINQRSTIGKSCVGCQSRYVNSSIGCIGICRSKRLGDQIIVVIVCSSATTSFGRDESNVQGEVPKRRIRR